MNHIKTSTLVLLIVFWGVATAPAQDTLRYKCGSYLLPDAEHFYNPSALKFESNPIAFATYWQLRSLFVMKYVVSSPIKIYGIAFTYFRTNKKVDTLPQPANLFPTLLVNRSEPYPIIDDNYTEWYSEHLIQDLELVNRVRGCDSGVFRKDVTFHYEYDLPTSGSKDVVSTEYYFDTPSEIEDTFYVGNIIMDTAENRMYLPSEYLLYGLYVIGDEEPLNTVYSPGMIRDWHKMFGEAIGLQPHEKDDIHNIGCINSKLFDTNYISWGGIIPIVGLRCTPPRGLKKTSQGKGWAWLRWRQFFDEGTSYEVRLWQYDDTTSADTLVVWDTLVTTTDTAQLFEGLALGGKYTCRIRKSCRYATPGYDTTVHSEWSEPVSFAIDTYDWEGIDEVPQLSFVLSPNPSRGVVELGFMQRQSDGGRVEVSDMHGRTVHAEPLPAGADALRLDLGRLPAGTYLVKVLTPAGLAARRLLLR